MTQSPKHPSTTSTSVNTSNNLYTFLSNYISKKPAPYTHVSKSPPGRYYVDEDDMRMFWSYYCSSIKNHVKPSIAEKPCEFMPLRVDIDFKVDLDVGEDRQYDMNIIKDIIELYQEELRQIIEEDSFQEKMLWCIVLEKPNPRVEDGMIKDGLHLHFPHFICEPWLQDGLLRNRVVSKITEKGVWSSVSMNGSIDSLLDKNIGTTPWMLYGSTNIKNSKSQPYLYTHAFDHNLNEISLDDVFEEEIQGCDKTVMFMLPKLLSVIGYMEPTPIYDQIDKQKSLYKKKPKKVNATNTHSIEKVMEDLKLITDAGFMDMLSDERADDEKMWMDVGWTLFNIGCGREEALDMWIEFSKRSDKFKDGECEERWSRMRMGNKTIGSLKRMAQIDNPNKYKEWKETDIRYFLFKSLKEKKPTEYDVAMVVKHMYDNRFLCADVKKEEWFEFINHKWNKIDDGITIRKLLCSEIIEKYQQLERDIVEKKNSKDEEDGCTDKEREVCEEQQKRCWKLMRELKTVSFCDKVLKMYKIHCHDPTFYKKIDENRHLIGCVNGVIDLELCIFREGRPDDYITFSTNIYYTKPDESEIEQLDKFFKQVFPNENRRKYIKRLLSACLEGGNLNKIFAVLTGCGNNAKSILMMFIEQAFGDYCIKFPSEMIILNKNNPSSAGPRPELARVRGRRIAAIQEIAKSETLNIRIIKELTGNDSFFARTLHEKGTEIRPMFTLFLQCNDPPKIPEHDEATWNRVRVVDFESKFDNKAPKSEPEQYKKNHFKADKNFAKKIPELASAFLYMLFEEYKIYKNEGLPEIEEVKMSTEFYKSQNDVYLQFIKDRLIKIENESEASKNGIKLTTLYEEFKGWYHENHSSYKVVPKITMKNELNKKLGVILNDGDIYGFGKKSVYWGYRINEENDEDEGPSIFKR